MIHLSRMLLKYQEKIQWLMGDHSEIQEQMKQRMYWHCHLDLLLLKWGNSYKFRVHERFPKRYNSRSYPYPAPLNEGTDDVWLETCPEDCPLPLFALSLFTGVFLLMMILLLDWSLSFFFCWSCISSIAMRINKWSHNILSLEPRNVGTIFFYITSTTDVHLSSQIKTRQPRQMKIQSCL